MSSGKPVDNEFGLSTVPLDTSGLFNVNRTLSFRAYLQKLWVRREFILADAQVKAFRTTRNYNWWRFWLIASPILEALLYGAIFSILLRTDRGIDNFVGFVILGITVFNIANRMLQGGIGLLEANKSFLQMFNFPHSAVVLSTALRYAIDTIPSFVIAVVAALAFQIGNPISWTVFLVIPLHLLLLIFGTGLMLMSARMTAWLPDTRALLDLFTRGWMFASGIFYPMERFATDPAIYAVFTANPAWRFIDAARALVMEGQSPSLREWGILAAWAIGTFVVGFLYFWKGEAKYAESL